jgi:phosphate-selective porin
VSAARYAAPSTSVLAAPADVWINYRAHDRVNVQVGQFDVPFTMENRTSDKYLPFMERSLAVRNLGAPTNKDLGAMVWGETEKREVYYSAGVFNGDGQNRPNADGRYDLFARVFGHPLLSSASPVKDLRIGASVHYGSRARNGVNYDFGSYTTQGNYAFWNPNHAGSDQSGNSVFVRVIPSGAQVAVAGELRVPYQDFDLTSEIVWAKYGTRESVDGYQSTNTERVGHVSGLAYYAQLGWWPLGNRDVNGVPGYENLPHADLAKQAAAPKRALQLLLKWEQLRVTYAGNDRGGSVDPKNADGDASISAISLGANYWMTRHLRLSANYVLNTFGDSASPSTPSQRAEAPGNTLAAGVNDAARADAHALHELLLRAAVAF